MLMIHIHELSIQLYVDMNVQMSAHAAQQDKNESRRIGSGRFTSVMTVGLGMGGMTFNILTVTC